ncbi:hypothetical protein ACJMK2_000141 [Sinanodonta woodiana]|uniref:Uncharacterized protein n=1 Tax=Sinanodonta woodiana TaxID=1069815 RepID=A0ABD3XQN7_SINWO
MARAYLFPSDRLSPILQCPLCLETMKRPRVIPCGHTFCTLCLQSHINNSLTNTETLHDCFPCAVCRATTVPSDLTLVADQWAKSFPLNSMVVSLLNICIGFKGMKSCDRCFKRCRQVSATCYCQDCHKSMCDSCNEYHGDFSVCKRENSLRFHEQIELDSVRVRPNLAFIEMCPKHPDERIKFICKDHQVLCCSTCGFLQHRMCDNITTLEDILQTTDVQIQSKEMETDLKKCNDYLKLITSRLSKDLDTMQNEKTTILQKVKTLIDQLSMKVVKFECDIVVSIEGTQNSEQTILRSHKTEASSLITSVDSDQNHLDLVMKHGSEVQKVIALHNLEQRHLMYQQTISNFLERVRVVTLTLDIDKHFQKILDSWNIFGEIKLTRKSIDSSQTRMQTIIPIETQFKKQKKQTAKEPTSQNNVTKTIVHMSKRRCSSETMPLWQRKVAKVKQFSARTGRDTNECHISDVVELHDSRLILVDKLNCKVKMFGPDCVCQNGLRLPDFPWNACVISNNMVAVTVPHQRTIQIIQTDKGVNKLREIATRFMCWGIAYLKDQLVVTAGTDGNCILVLTLNGTELRCIGSDNYQLSQPSCITTNRSNTAIYVTYQGDHRLVSYSLDWDVIFTYTDHDMRGPCGVDTDREGNIYLCGYQSNNLQQITHDGKLIKTILTGKQKFLRHRCSRNRDKLFLTYMNSAVVEVYHLQ